MFFIYDLSVDNLSVVEGLFTTEHDHERERGVRTGLRVSSLYESVHTKGDNKHGWKLVRAEGRRDDLNPLRSAFFP